MQLTKLPGIVLQLGSLPLGFLLQLAPQLLLLGDGLRSQFLGIGLGVQQRVRDHILVLAA